MDKGLLVTDFGRGFYTTTWHQEAVVWSEAKARRYGGSKPAVLQLRLKRENLGKLTSMAFIRSSLDASDYWSFVANCRNRHKHIPTRPSGWYDVVYGPVTQNWKPPANARVWEGYDQISFHTDVAQALLNNKRVCRVEVL